MRNGFTFKDRHSSEFGVTVQTKSRPIRPSVKTYEVSMPHRDGSYDFSKSNSMGREMYNDRYFTVIISAGADDICDMQTKISRLSTWLMGSGDLIFDDMPLSVWKARLSDEIIYMPEHGGKKAVMEVTFHTEPFCDCAFDEQGPALEDAVLLSSEIPLEMDGYYRQRADGDSQMRIMNFGDCPMRPVIKLISAACDVQLSLNGKTLFFWKPDTAEPVFVDFEKQQIINDDEICEASGEFFEFPPGENILRIKSVFSDDITTTVYFTPKFMYDVDLSNIDWGDENA